MPTFSWCGLPREDATEFTPFYFIKAGLYVSLPALWSGLAVIAFLLFLKLATKTVGTSKKLLCIGSFWLLQTVPKDRK